MVIGKIRVFLIDKLVEHSESTNFRLSASEVLIFWTLIEKKGGVRVRRGEENMAQVDRD